jgi:hypothetical protein
MSKYYLARKKDVLQCRFLELNKMNLSVKSNVINGLVQGVSKKVIVERKKADVLF